MTSAEVAVSMKLVVVTANRYAPTAVGVPVSSPPDDKARPGGRASPGASANVGAGKPDATSCRRNDRPWVASRLPTAAGPGAEPITTSTGAAIVAVPCVLVAIRRKR